MPLLTYAVYIVLLVLLVWGGKIATKKKTTDGFHDDFMSLEVTKSLRGLAAIGVILHHISQEALFQQCKELSFFVNAGYFFVAIFFFCSGYGLYKSIKSNKIILKQMDLIGKIENISNSLFRLITPSFVNLSSISIRLLAISPNVYKTCSFIPNAI